MVVIEVTSSLFGKQYHWLLLKIQLATNASRQNKETELLLCMAEAMIFIYHVQSRTQ